MDKRESNTREGKAENLNLMEKGKYMTCNNKKLTSDWVDKLQIYQTGMDHEQNIRTAYQSLLTTLEVALFTTILILKEAGFTTYIWVISMIGIFLCFPFGIACEYRARNVDIWRIHIVKLVEKTDVWDTFKESKYRWIPFGKVGFWGEFLFGHWFERMLISGMLTLWLILLWSFPSPFLIRFCSILAIFGWIIYAFRIKEIKGEIIPYIYRR